MLEEFFLVGCGGFVGSVARYYLGGAAFQILGAPKFPVSTVFVNLVGCFIIGILGAMSEHLHYFAPGTRLLIFTGVLGGFTTFSAFGLDTFFLIRTGSFGLALANVALQVIGGLAMVWAGYWIVMKIAG